MPIDFRPPQPFAPGISQAAGAAQAEQQNTGLMAQLYEQAGLNRAAAARHAADTYNHAAGQEADRFAQNDRTGAALGEQAQESADRLQFQKDALAASRQPSARDVFAAQVGEAQALQHAQLQTWAKQQDFTFADNQAYQRQLAHLNDLNQAHDDKVLTDQEWGEQVLQLKTGIDLAKGRQEDAQAKMMQSHAAAYEAQAKRQTAIAVSNATTAAKSLGDRTNMVYDPQAMAQIQREHPDWSQQQVAQEAVLRGAYTQYVEQGIDQYGHMTGHFIEGHGRQKGKGAAGQADTSLGGLTPEQTAKHYREIVTDTDKLIERNQELMAKTDPTTGKSLGLGDPNITWGNRTKLIDDAWAASQSQLRREHGPGAPGQSGPGPGSGQIPTPVAPPDMQPFETNDKASLKQKAVLDISNELVANVRKLPIPEEVKDDYARAQRVSMAMLREYGRIDPAAMASMSEKDRDALTAAGRTIDRIEAMTFRGRRVVSPARQAVEGAGRVGPFREGPAGPRSAVDVRPWLRQHVGQPVDEFFTPRSVPEGQ